MIAHQLDADGVIITTLEVDSLDILENLVEATMGGKRGDRIVDGKLVPAPEPGPVVPVSIPMLNARLTMIGAGWMTQVKAYLASLPGVEGEQAREYFEFAQTMRRDHPLVLGIPAALGKTEAEVDALFIAAGALDA